MDTADVVLETLAAEGVALRRPVAPRALVVRRDSELYRLAAAVYLDGGLVRGVFRVPAVDHELVHVGR
ncbi:hypothetical protein [Streptomyces sp. 7N604]|uniref:hypothetical protein n=1 Tax=Streptomyces sp. 7N604 TaxID=3457415 RepID=UPI003FD1D4BF